MDTSAKIAVVTGANSGIGLALTKKLLAEGIRVIATARAGQINGLHHANLTVIPLDITDAASIEQAVTHISQLAPSIDLLVNNAGIAPDVMSIAPPDRTSFRDTFATNVDGTVFFTEPMLGQLKDGAQVVFISSSMGLPKHAGPNGTAYRLSKAAVNMYAAMLAQRVAERHIRVTPLHPGWVQTRLGGESAPFTPEQAANGIFQGIEACLERSWLALAPTCLFPFHIPRSACKTDQSLLADAGPASTGRRRGGPDLGARADFRQARRVVHN